MKPSNDEAQDIEVLRERYNVLNEKKITAQAELNRSTRDLEDLKKQALEKYSTDDLVLLRAKLEEMIKENQRMRREYQERLDQIERELTEVERQHDEAAAHEAQP